MSALGGATAQEEGLGATMPHQSSLCPYSIWRFFHPLMPTKLLCLGRDPRVEERSPYSESEHSGFNSCSAEL